jgi:hypothetical protein
MRGVLLRNWKTVAWMLPPGFAAGFILVAVVIDPNSK